MPPGSSRSSPVGPLGQLPADECSLGFILASPAMTSGARTLNMASRTAAILGFGTVQTANLFSEPTWNTGELSTAGSRPEGWLTARAHLTATLASCDEVVGAWGIARCRGEARAHQQSQIDWVVREAERLGHGHLWMLGGEPRHPSRWHQYVSEYHGRAGTGELDARLRSQLRRVKLADIPGLSARACV